MKASKLVTKAAQERVREAAPQRKLVQDAIRSGRPLDAESDSARKVNRIQAVTGTDRKVAEAVARYDPTAVRRLQGETRLGAERIQGKTVDFVSTSFLELAIAAAGTVGRVVFRDLQPQGSGFMISDRLFLTNNHVIPDVAEAGRLLVEFNYERDHDGIPKPVTRFELAPDIFFVTDPEDQLDFTVVAIGGTEAGAGSLTDFGYCPLVGTDDKHVLGEFVNLVQHPDGDFKQVVLRENQLVTRLETVLHYMADTMPGSSGSPVFNDQWQVIALHHWGEPYREETMPDGQAVPKDLNEGIRISAIVQALMTKASTMSGAKRSLLMTALTSPSRRPSTLRERPQPAPSVIPCRRDSQFGDVALPVFAKASPGGAATWTVPIEISVRVGGALSIAQAAEAPNAMAAAREAIKIDQNYANRPGYDPDFLSGNPVSLPSLNDAQRAEAARLLQAPTGADPYELPYQHFSIVMNAARRMAFFTAANIDGSTWIDIKRDEGESREAEATEKWFNDPRIPPDAQCQQDLYDAQEPKRVFDRGHLVRRQDPAWGTAARAKKANADTFHFTNCTPQESRFNQRVQYWQGIEKYVLENATAEGERVSVFTGPVLAADDPAYRYVQVPMAFWKIVARVEGGQLLATALLADQSQLIEQLPERLGEGYDDLGAVAEYQTSVSEIEQLTGLDFGPLRDGDTFEPAPAEAATKRRRLTRIEDLALNRVAR